MANLITHANIALDILDQMPNDVSSVVSKYTNIFKTACQGLDAPLYTIPSPILLPDTYKNIIYNKDTAKINLILNTLLHKISKISKSKAFQKSFAFLIGLIVYYEIELSKINNYSSDKNSLYKNDTTFIYKNVFPTKKLPLFILKLLDFALYKSFSEKEFSKVYAESIFNLNVNSKKFKYDFLKIKKSIYKKIKIYNKLVFPDNFLYRDKKEVASNSSTNFEHIFENCITKINLTYDYFTHKNIYSIIYFHK